ncbi:MAG: GntR family transcriptional regulator [Oscillospiraceae bacterium]|jgi:DNA-binding GntR family transcriptional regulator|nr:GntR family transcriptional regulator [Oscillospiraceae bacterium]MBQ5712176.1 GntR family transcriptional regulator [Oscillospiraceae bacterium]
MKTFKSTSLADQVFDKLENDIIQGVYPKGEILTELKLVEQLGVSRTPIRDALRRLEQERLIADTGKGSLVLGITDDDLLDIMNIRERIEGLAAYYAAKNITPETAAELTHITDLQDFYFSKRDLDRLRQVDDQFHDTICLLSGRTVISDTLIPLHRKTRRYRRIAMEDWSRATQTTREHYEICQAIVDGNAELAQKLMSQHITNAKVHMIKGD